MLHEQYNHHFLIISLLFHSLQSKSFDALRSGVSRLPIKLSEEKLMRLKRDQLIELLIIDLYGEDILAAYKAYDMVK